jgi:hypothetical protein
MVVIKRTGKHYDRILCIDYLYACGSVGRSPQQVIYSLFPTAKRYRYVCHASHWADMDIRGVGMF